MGEALHILLGVLIGLAIVMIVVGGSVFVEIRRKPGRRSWFAPPADDVDGGSDFAGSFESGSDCASHGDVGPGDGS